jgi:hypothetical protein
VNDKDRELVQQILQAGGAAAQKGFEELVRWCFADALANVLCYAAVAGIAIFALVRLLKWKLGDNYDSEFAHVARGAGLLLCIVVLAIATGSWLPGNLRELVAPTGEAVAYVLSHH